MAESIMMEFPSKYEYLNLINIICGEIADDMQLESSVADEVAISVIEACTNALEHGNKSSPEKCIRIVINRHPDRIVVEVYDRGDGFDYKEYLEHIPDPSNIQETRGRGIFIMKEMMDNLSFEFVKDRGMKVTLEKRLNGSKKK
ncbi:MAG: ATP-binding protein [Candidatus Krumholzibacteriota bacterium]|nr:ATP-binding protein [Candidatus Krumholzibacteriota bacterium]